MTTVKTGLECLIESSGADIAGARIGLLCNPASVDSELNHARIRIADRFKGRLKALYSPQHGFFAEKQDNMIESDHLIDPALKIPVFSLYGKTHIPTPEMFDPIDTLIIDLQDVGTRVYTFIYTVSYCLEAAKQLKKQVLVLDRPNPVGGIMMEGNILKPEYSSFVGRYPIPMRHGLTIGEISLLFNSHFGIGCNLTVIPMKGWHRRMFFSDTGLPWVPPSPNIPIPTSAIVYPGQVLFEGTNISEGRGTTRPFEIFGAPFLDTKKILSTIGGNRQPGAILRECAFEPMFNKWKGNICNGFHIHITDANKYLPYQTSLMLLRAIMLHHRDDFQWKLPPYEYELERLPIDLITGDIRIRLFLETAQNIDTLFSSWDNALSGFVETSRRFHLY